MNKPVMNIEGYSLQEKNASIWTVLEAFQREESLARVTNNEAMRNIHDGHNLSRRESMEKRKHEIRSLCENFDVMGVMEYLESVVPIMFE